jgi:hypothetical protein
MININPNWVAYLALLLWPVVGFCLYARLPVGRATLWTILGGYLLLPVDAVIKTPGIPGFDKQSIPNLTALIGCAICARQAPKLNRGGLAEILILLVLAGPFVTSMLNTDPVRVGDVVLPGLSIYEAGSVAFFQLIFIFPFFLGRQYLGSAEDNADVLRIMVIAGLAYSLPMLFEIRMSPQLNRWIYGYYPHSFFQQMRDGGFRPMAFLGHGLLVSFFAMTTTAAAAALWRTQTRIGRWPAGRVTGYLSVVVVLCKTGSALAYGALLVPLIRWASPRAQLRVACILVTIALTYPLLRVADLVPTTSILEVAGAVSTDRELSLKTRFDQEHQLLNHAWDRLWFGWGRFGRNRVYDAESGKDVSISDGYWVITMGVFGLVGYIGIFGLMALTVFRAATALKFAKTNVEKQYMAALGLIVAISVFDLLPNSTISSWTWLLVGALMGRAEAVRAVSRQRISFQEAGAISRPLHNPETTI